MGNDRIWLVGAYGLLGSEFQELLNNEVYYKSSSQEADITDLESLHNYISDKQDIKYIINCAACCDAEYLENNYEYGYNVNVLGPKNLGIIANELNAILIHISTDYVFDGKKSTPYTELDSTNPLSVYGKLKDDAEKLLMQNVQNLYIFRTAWLFSKYRRDFIKTIKRIATTNDNIKVIYDQVGPPCYAKDLAHYILQSLPKLKSGKKEIYHLTNEGVASWYDLAVRIITYYNIDCEVIPIHSYEFNQKAKRPSYSVLDKTKFKNDFGIKLRHYSEGLQECMKEIWELNL